MECSLPGSSVRGILQARVLEWVAISFSRIALRNPTLIAIWSLSWETGPGRYVFPLGKTSNCNLGAPAYNPRPQLMSLVCTQKCSSGFPSTFTSCLFHLVSHKTSWTLMGRGRQGWPGPQGLKRFQDPLPFLSEAPPDLLVCLQASMFSPTYEAWTRLNISLTTSQLLLDRPCFPSPPKWTLSTSFIHFKLKKLIASWSCLLLLGTHIIR